MSGAQANSWQSVRDEVLRRIHRREWAPGELIPGEAALAREFGCARATVNRALRELAAAGLLDRRRRAGTRIAPHPVGKATFEILVIRREIEARGARYGHVLIRREIAPPPPGLRGRLALPQAARALHVEALHTADGRPHAFEDRWINQAAIPAVRCVDFEATSANEWLLANAPFTEGDVDFTAAAASPREADLLGAAPGAALFVVERTTRDGATPITTVRLCHAPGYRMSTHLGPRRAGG